MKTILVSLLALGLAASVFAQPKGRVNQRETNQKARIKEGVKDGSLNNKEAARLRTREGAIEAKEARDRADGKGFTAKEKAQAEHRQDKLSQDIYKQRHDGQTTSSNNHQPANQPPSVADMSQTPRR